MLILHYSIRTLHVICVVEDGDVFGAILIDLAHLLVDFVAASQIRLLHVLPSYHGSPVFAVEVRCTPCQCDFLGCTLVPSEFSLVPPKFCENNVVAALIIKPL